MNTGSSLCKPRVDSRWLGVPLFSVAARRMRERMAGSHSSSEVEEDEDEDEEDMESDAAA